MHVPVFLSSFCFLSYLFIIDSFIYFFIDKFIYLLIYLLIYLPIYSFLCFVACLFLEKVSSENDSDKKSCELRKLANLFREHSVEHVLEVSSLGHEMSKWGAIADRSQTLIPQLSRFLVTMTEVSVRLSYISYASNTIYSHLLNVMKKLLFSIPDFNFIIYHVRFN